MEREVDGTDAFLPPSLIFRLTGSSETSSSGLPNQSSLL